MAKKDDGLHYSLTKLLSYDKTFNFVVSEREPGKSTSIWRLVYGKWKKTGRPSIALRRRQVDVSEEYIRSIEDTVNEWFDDNVELKYGSGLSQGAVLVSINKKPFVLILALSNPLNRIKSLTIKDPAYMIMDEFICNTRMGEKYLKDEAFRFKEIYSTFYRHCEDGHSLKCIFAGNPYSRYNPYWVDFKVPLGKIKRGGPIITGANWAVEVYEMKPELREYIKAHNPLYQFDDTYTRYAFDGEAVNDSNIIVWPKLPPRYSLRYCFRYNDKLIGVYSWNPPANQADQAPGLIRTPMIPMWCGYLHDEGQRRSVYCFDFNQLQDGTALVSILDKTRFSSFQRLLGQHRVAFEDVSVDYAIEDIFDRLGSKSRR